MTDQADFGVVGLGVMGASLALNMEEKGSRVALMDLDPEKAKAMVQEAGEGAKLVPAEDTRGFVAALRVPRRILIMVPAGKPVEASLESLAPHLDPGDVVIDGGNEFYTETERRQKRWLASGIHLIGMGVSGGQEGARRGPSMMPGGDEGAYREVEPVLQSIAAQVEDGACVTYIGQGGSGHFVKMVHNGIEYADMELIAEVYDLLRNAGGVSADNLADTFGAWNQGPLESFLVEITADILRKADDADPSRPLVDAILDSAKMKGTGSWTVKEGAELASPMPTIGSAVEARLMSGLKGLRGRTSQVLVGPSPGDAPPADGKTWIDDARDALYAAKICAYAQGMGVLQAAAEERGWALDLAEISRIW
ncbi:MAG: NADP-dependent phosphogluconate dehydrogenase, partial [Myxococcota bacterium]